MSFDEFIWFLTFFLIAGQVLTCHALTFASENIHTRACSPFIIRRGFAASSRTNFHGKQKSNVLLHQTRNEFLKSTVQNSVGAAAAALVAFGEVASAFEGGVGGLGKTKPNTGVEFWDETLSLPVQNSQGTVSAELNVGGQPVLTTFQSPWPLLPTTTGLETRNLQTPESAFVQVVTRTNSDNGDPSSSKSGMLDFLQTSILSPQGKYGAYGAPIDIKIDEWSIVPSRGNTVTCRVIFTTFTPSLIETDRRILLKAIRLVSSSSSSSSKNSHWIVLVAGTTRQRFKAQESILRSVIDSFQVTPIPSQMFRAPKVYQREL
jgi:hypothetical protein